MDHFHLRYESTVERGESRVGRTPASHQSSPVRLGLRALAHAMPARTHPRWWSPGKEPGLLSFARQHQLRGHPLVHFQQLALTRPAADGLAHVASMAIRHFFLAELSRL